MYDTVSYAPNNEMYMGESVLLGSIDGKMSWREDEYCRKPKNGDLPNNLRGTICCGGREIRVPPF